MGYNVDVDVFPFHGEKMIKSRPTKISFGMILITPVETDPDN